MMGIVGEVSAVVSQILVGYVEETEMINVSSTILSRCTTKSRTQIVLTRVTCRNSEVSTQCQTFDRSNNSRELSVEVVVESLSTVNLIVANGITNEVCTLEVRIVRVVDRTACLCHDITLSVTHIERIDGSNHVTDIEDIT